MRNNRFEALATSTAVDRLARNVVSGGVHWDPSGLVHGDYSRDPIPFVLPVPQQQRRLLLRKNGRGFAPCKLEVLGVETEPRSGKNRRWVCRCACGNYCRYTSAQLTGFKASKAGFYVERKQYRECPVCTYFSEKRSLALSRKGRVRPDKIFLEDEQVKAAIDLEQTDPEANWFNGRRIGRIFVLGPARHHEEMIPRPPGKVIARCDCGRAFVATRKGIAAGGVLECAICRNSDYEDAVKTGNEAAIIELKREISKSRLQFLDEEASFIDEKIKELISAIGRHTNEDRVRMNKLLARYKRNRRIAESIEGE